MLDRQENRKHRGLSLTAEERETIISWNDEDGDKIFIYTSQQPQIRKLLNNPLFECTDKRYNKSYACYPGPISVEGYLPRSALSIKKKIRKLTDEQRKEAAERLKIARKARKR
jgi:hypothetical protein